MHLSCNGFTRYKGSKTARECIQSIQDHQHSLDLDLKAGTLGRFSAFSLPTRDPVHPLKRIGSLVSVGGHLTPSSIYNVTLGFGRVNPF
ncbi:hypothetical protein VNO78_36371 [Psophocarpus tetragonolobus]|uniref:Uncharacterized protein n=1 Tax=Psophocarpus tetragonolobus TaxID=3891 RepID=A0AAN9NIV6_PSOTE